MPRRAGKKSESTRRPSMKQTTTGKPSASRAAKSETHESKTKRATAAKPQAGTARKASKAAAPRQKRGILSRAATTIRRVLKRGKATEETVQPVSQPAERPQRPKEAPKAARVARREADIPLDRIAQTYTPTQTSLKGPFRTSGADRQRDQEFATGVDDDRWNDEDRFTNKSGDPRIGTHRRTYEPGEARAAAAKDSDE